MPTPDWSRPAALTAKQPKDAIAILNDSLANDKPGPEACAASVITSAWPSCRRAAGKGQGAARRPGRDPRRGRGAVRGWPGASGGEAVRRGRRRAGEVPERKPDGEVADFALGHLAHARVELGQIDEAFKALDLLAQRFPKSKVLNPTRLRVAESPMAVKDHADLRWSCSAK